jgi:hypothetical protein
MVLAEKAFEKEEPVFQSGKSAGRKEEITFWRMGTASCVMAFFVIKPIFTER